MGEDKRHKHGGGVFSTAAGVFISNRESTRLKEQDEPGGAASQF